MQNRRGSGKEYDRPTRPATPRDKAKVEVTVQVAARWILARLRHETLFSLAALNTRIDELLTAVNARPMKGYGGGTPRDPLEQFDRPALQALPAERFVHADRFWAQDELAFDAACLDTAVCVHDLVEA